MAYIISEEAMRIFNKTGNGGEVCRSCQQYDKCGYCAPKTRKPCSYLTGFHKFKSKGGTK